MTQTPEFKHAFMFQMGDDETEYHLLTRDGVSVDQFEGKPALKMTPEVLAMLTQQAFHNVSLTLRRVYNERVAKTLTDPGVSDNDKYMALSFLRNAEAVSRGKLPLCQDAGAAIVHGGERQQVWAGFYDEETTSRGAYDAYTQDNSRYSQDAPFNTRDEVNIRCSLPTRIDLEATEGMEHKFLSVTKGGGSANKTYLYQMTRAIIQNSGTLIPSLVEKMKPLGMAACPPYHIAFVVGGISAEKDLLTVKLTSTHYYDDPPTSGDGTGRALRDVALEGELLDRVYKIGLGARSGGKYMAHDIRIVRLPCHSVSCPIRIGASCLADRNIKAKINKEGLWTGKPDESPGSLISEELRQAGEGDVVEISLNQPMVEICKELSQYPVSTHASLDDMIIVVRNIAHAKLKARLDAGEELSEYLKNHPILYAGPAKTPEGMPCGSMGPTTASHMDPYVGEFQNRGGSMVMIAKGNRTQVVAGTRQKYGSFYLGSISGPAVVLSMNSIESIERVGYPELGMEAIWKIDAVDFPALVLVGDKGNDFFKQLKPWTSNYAKQQTATASHDCDSTTSFVSSKLAVAH